MKITRSELKRMILKEMYDSMPVEDYSSYDFDQNNDVVVSRKDFMLAASNIGNILHGMGMEPNPSQIKNYFKNLIAVDYNQPDRINNVVPNPGKYGSQYDPAGLDIMNALRAIGLTRSSPLKRYKQPGAKFNEGAFDNDLSAFADEVAKNIGSRNRY